MVRGRCEWLENSQMGKKRKNNYLCLIKNCELLSFGFLDKVCEFFQIGTEASPFRHQAVITLHGHLRSPELPVYGAKTLAVREGTLDLHGRLKTPQYELPRLLLSWESLCFPFLSDSTPEPRAPHKQVSESRSCLPSGPSSTLFIVISMDGQTLLPPSAIPNVLCILITLSEKALILELEDGNIFIFISEYRTFLKYKNKCSVILYCSDISGNCHQVMRYDHVWSARVTLRKHELSHFYTDVFHTGKIIVFCEYKMPWTGILWP